MQLCLIFKHVKAASRSIFKQIITGFSFCLEYISCVISAFSARSQYIFFIQLFSNNN